MCRNTADDIRATDLCQAFSNATVLVVGDSLSYLVYASLVMRAGNNHDDSVEERHHQHLRDGVPLVTSLCGGLTTLKFVRNDRLLDPSPEKLLQELGILPNWNSMRPFWGEVDDADIVLFNRGAHYVADAVLEQELREFSATLRQRMRPTGQLIFYRTTAPGHPHCSNFTSPGNVPDLTDNRPEFGWRAFQHQNELAERTVEGTAPGVVSFIDIYNTTLPRRDRHIWGPRHDCLHYCLPGNMPMAARAGVLRSLTSNNMAACYMLPLHSGPVDWWASIFAHRVLQHRKALLPFGDTGFRGKPPAVAVTAEYRGPVTAVAGGFSTGVKYVGQDGEAVGEDEYGMGWLEVKFADGRVDSFDPENLNLPVAGVLTAGMPAIARAASASR